MEEKLFKAAEEIFPRVWIQKYSHPYVYVDSDMVPGRVFVPVPHTDVGLYICMIILNKNENPVCTTVTPTGHETHWAERRRPCKQSAYEAETFHQSCQWERKNKNRLPKWTPRRHGNLHWTVLGFSPWSAVFVQARWSSFAKVLDFLQHATASVTQIFYITYVA